MTDNDKDTILFHDILPVNNIKYSITVDRSKIKMWYGIKIISSFNTPQIDLWLCTAVITK